MKNSTWKLVGFFIKGTSAAEGICRRVWNDGTITEGMFRNDKLNGYGRVIFTDGGYYVG